MKNYRINGEIVGGVSKSRIDKIVLMHIELILQITSIQKQNTV